MEQELKELNENINEKVDNFINKFMPNIQKHQFIKPLKNMLVGINLVATSLLMTNNANAENINLIHNFQLISLYNVNLINNKNKIDNKILQVLNNNEIKKTIKNSLKDQKIKQKIKFKDISIKQLMQDFQNDTYQKFEQKYHNKRDKLEKDINLNKSDNHTEHLQKIIKSKETYRLTAEYKINF